MIPFLIAMATTLVPLQTLAGAPAPNLPKEERQLVVFWASWCKDCKEKLKTGLPELDARPDVTVIPINIDRDVERARNFVESNEITLPVYREPEKLLQTRHKVFAVPYWIVFRGSADEIVDEGSGYDQDRILRALEKR